MIVFPSSELAAGLLQATITFALTLLCWGMWRRTRDAYFGWWAVAFGLYSTRVAMIVMFLATNLLDWLFFHQIATGWTALALLWAAIAFAGTGRWRHWYWLLLVFPPLWSWMAIYELEDFFLASFPAVAFLSAATLWTGWVFWRHRGRAHSGVATLMAWTFGLWGLHHLDYPLLRARGAWNPWGYYIDILFLLAVGAGVLLLVNADLAERLRLRTAELERLSRRMVQQHEEERRRLSLALHDETAQVFAAVKMQLGLVEERAGALAPQVRRAVDLVDDGIRGIRSVTNDLRPALLDDLGLIPALRSLVADFNERRDSAVELGAPPALPLLADEAEVALFRALQEGLSNGLRHAPQSTVQVALAVEGGSVVLRLTDDGPGFDAAQGFEAIERAGHLGLAGMRERIAALGGVVELFTAPGQGTRLVIRVPVDEELQVPAGTGED